MTFVLISRKLNGVSRISRLSIMWFIIILTLLLFIEKWHTVFQIQHLLYNFCELGLGAYVCLRYRLKASNRLSDLKMYMPIRYMVNNRIWTPYFKFQVIAFSTCQRHWFWSQKIVMILYLRTLHFWDLYWAQILAFSQVQSLLFLWALFFWVYTDILAMCHMFMINSNIVFTYIEISTGECHHFLRGV